jgi:hypothetical protein
LAGGSQSAFGYRYQYLATIERFLRYLRDHLGELATIALHVEPTTLMSEGIARDDDIIDFAIELDDEIVERDQVKGSSNPDGNKLYHGEAETVFERLNGEFATHSVLVTNRPLGPSLQERCLQVLDTDDIEEWDYAGPGSDEVEDDADSLIVVDKRSVEGLEDAIEGLVRQFRSDQALGQGSVSCRIIAKLLLNKIFQSAAGDGPAKFSALEIIGFISIPDPDIAHVVGGFDWGVPVNGIPVLPSTVTRLHLLEQVHQAIGRPADGHQVKHLVTQGQTGYGKSSLAAHFCHLYRNSYEFICWIDCSDTGLIEANIRRFVQELTRTELPLSIDPSEQFREALASHRGPWLVVFDGLPARVDIDGVGPTQGNGCVLVTTTNETGWWPSSTILNVGTFTEDEATACFASYAGLNTANERSDAVREIVARLGFIPLAIAMAALYFRNAAGTVGELSAGYFAQLEALEDIGSIPPGFDRTAFAAIEYAVRHLGSGVIGHDHQDVRMVQAMLYRASLLAPDMIPLNYLIASMPEDVEMHLGDLPEPSFADAALRRRYISIMRTQSIAERVLLLDDDGEQNEASDTIDIHPLVHEILRRLFVRQIPPVRLSEQITMMMHYLHGWIAHARRRNQYSVVDQLAAQAVSLLGFTEQSASLPTRNQQHAKMFLYTKSWLKLEVSTCRMSRGDVYTSVNLAREVLHELWTRPPDPVREALALQAASSIVVDLNEAGTDASTMRPWALFGLRAVIACESLNAKGAALAFEKAYLVRSSLNGRTQYCEDAVIARVIHELDEMIARDPSDELRPNAVMDELVKQIDAGDLGYSVDARLATLRAAANDYDKHTFDCIEVDIALQRSQFDEAFRGIDELVARPLHQTHGARPLSRGLVNIYRTLEKLIAAGVGPVEKMQFESSRVLARAEELHQQIIREGGNENL